MQQMQSRLSNHHVTALLLRGVPRQRDTWEWRGPLRHLRQETLIDYGCCAAATDHVIDQGPHGEPSRPEMTPFVPQDGAIKHVEATPAAAIDYTARRNGRK
mmetsp:Transcript_12780/g.28816  ORF Transcript_12780/g.28816 Transcript_12780/m.28816 type:complete len:101 (-) Transcript_12780:253-555(-)